MIASLLLVVGFGKERELMRERERKREYQGRIWGV
jgi:hypothetical protein